MTDYVRDGLLERHDFYVEQVRERVLVHFKDIEGEADRFADAEFARLGRVVNPELWDEGDVAEAAIDRGQTHYMLLVDLRMQMRLSALAGLYHQLDKELREFLERELSHYYKREAVVELIWHTAELAKVLDFLRDDFGWDCRTDAFSLDLDACRLIVNVHKHGKGPSLSALAKRHPEFLRDELETSPKWGDASLEHRWLEVTDEQFARLAASLRSFWEAFPELLYSGEPP